MEKKLVHLTMNLTGLISACFCFTSATDFTIAKETHKYGYRTVQAKNGTIFARQCLVCPAGHELNIACDASIIKEDINEFCVQCPVGYAKEEKGSDRCTRCLICLDNQEVIVQCAKETLTVCGECKKGYGMTPDGASCSLCSPCPTSGHPMKSSGCPRDKRCLLPPTNTQNVDRSKVTPALANKISSSKQEESNYGILDSSTHVTHNRSCHIGELLTPDINSTPTAFSSSAPEELPLHLPRSRTTTEIVLIAITCFLSVGLVIVGVLLCKKWILKRRWGHPKHFRRYGPDINADTCDIESNSDPNINDDAVSRGIAPYPTTNAPIADGTTTGDPFIPTTATAANTSKGPMYWERELRYDEVDKMQGLSWPGHICGNLIPDVILDSQSISPYRSRLREVLDDVDKPGLRDFAARICPPAMTHGQVSNGYSCLEKIFSYRTEMKLSTMVYVAFRMDRPGENRFMEIVRILHANNCACGIDR